MSRYFDFSCVFAALVVAGGAAHADCGPPPAPVPVPASTPAQIPTQQVIVTPETSKQSASSTAGIISDRVSSVVSAIGGGGASAESPPVMNACAALGENASGGVAPAHGIWTAGSLTSLRKTDQGGNYAGNIATTLAGYDQRVGNDFLLGLAAGYEYVSIATKFNAGTLKANSGTIAPYAGYRINDWLDADLTVGGTWITYDSTRNDGANTGETSAFRWFGATNLTATQRLPMDNSTVLKLSVGYIRLYENQNGYSETGNDGNTVAASQVNFGQLRSTLSASRDYAADIGMFSPIVSVRLEEDVPHPQAISLGNGLVSTDGRFGVTVGGGVQLLTHDGLQVSISATTTQFRQNTQIYGGAFDVRYNF